LLIRVLVQKCFGHSEQISRPLDKIAGPPSLRVDETLRLFLSSSLGRHQDTGLCEMQGRLVFIHVVANKIAFEHEVIKERVENGIRWLGSASLDQNSANKY
jgi:hypothetical protein